MFSAVTNWAGKTALAGLVVTGMGLAMLGSSGAAHAQPNDSGDTTTGCKWASTDYKEGDKVKQDDGNTYRCHEGIWVLAIVTPPPNGGTKFNKLPTAGVLQRAQ